MGDMNEDMTLPRTKNDDMDKHQGQHEDKSEDTAIIIKL